MSEKDRREYEMPQAYFDELEEASKAAREMYISEKGRISDEMDELAYAIWRRMGAELGFDWKTVGASKNGRRWFTAVPLPVQPKDRPAITDALIDAMDKFGADFADGKIGGREDYLTALERILSSLDKVELRPAIKSAIHAITAAKTMNDVMALLRLAETKEEATALRAKYVSTIGDPRAEEIADHNIGYMTGYYGREEAKRLLDLYGVSHPIFGRSHVDGTLTPERALQMGMEMGRATREAGDAS